MLQTAREVAGLSYDEAAARLGCEADWLVRVETGFAAAGPDEVARILVEYGVREARAADTIIDMARRAAAPPPWLAPHTSRMSAAARDVLLVEAEATLAQVHGFLLIPYLVADRRLLPGDRAGSPSRMRRRPGMGPALPPPGAPARRRDPAASR